MAIKRQRAGSTGIPPERGDGGFVLVVVIWLLALLGLAAAAYSIAVRSDVRTAFSTAEQARAMMLADAGINLALQQAVLASSVRRGSTSQAAGGQRTDCRMGDGSITYVAEDEAGRVDINVASEALLTALLAGAGVAADEAQRLTDALIDFRDSDQVRRPRGAEAEDYRAAGLLYGPKDAPFDVVEELGEVLGFDSEIIARLQPHITVSSGLTGVDPAAVSADLVELLAQGAVTRMAGVAARTSEGEAIAQPSRLPAAFAAVSPRRTYRLTSLGRAGRGAAFAREAIVRIAPSRGSPFLILRWRQIPATGPIVPLEQAMAGLPEC